MLIRHIRVLLTLDVNNGGGASSDTTKDVNKEDSSTSGATEGSKDKTDVKPLVTLADVAKGVLDKAVAKEKQEDSSSKSNEDGSILSSNQTDKEGDEEASLETDEGKKEGEVEKKEEGDEKSEDKVSGDEDDKSPVPYQRFQEVVKERQTYEQKLKEVEPLVEAHKSVVEFCQTNQITESQFREGMEFLRMVNVDPIAARAALEPIWNQLNGLSGEVLPADLAQEVEDGVISEARAKEIAKYRGQMQVNEAKGKLAEQNGQKQQQIAFQRDLNTALTSWTSHKQTIDPGFKPKSAENAVDGKFEFVADRFYKLMSSNPPKTAADAVKLVEQAYNDVSKTFTSFGSKQKPTNDKVISSTKASTNSKTEPKTVQEAVKAALAKHSA